MKWRCFVPLFVTILTTAAVLLQLHTWCLVLLLLLLRGYNISILNFIPLSGYLTANDTP